MLTLRIELLTGCYVASKYNDRTRPEWPPHPARVFSALVAAHHGCCSNHLTGDALRWLEQQPPPALAFSAAHPRDVKTHFVPVNDVAINDVAIVARAWQKVYDASLSDTQREKAWDKLLAAYEKEGQVLSGLPKNAIERGRYALPESRLRQPRVFPSVAPEDPVVWLVWPRDPPPVVADALQRLAFQLGRLGHSSSLVAASFSTGAQPQSRAPSLVPHPDGDRTLRWVSGGQLSALENLHERAPYAEQRVMPYSVARYRIPAGPMAVVPESRFEANMIVLRRAEGARLSILASERVSSAVRKAVMSHAADPIPPVISGHASDGSPIEQDHLAVVPLSFVDHPHATGDLLGVALVLPVETSDADRASLYRAVAAWESEGAELKLGRLGAWRLERCVDTPALTGLQDTTWTRPSAVWASVSPVVLDRHPGDIHARRSDRRRASLARAVKTVGDACERIGLPRPLSVEFSPAPFVNGAAVASEHRRRQMRKDHRPYTHILLRFPVAVRGPVLLGAQRYRGLGLCCPVKEVIR